MNRMLSGLKGPDPPPQALLRCHPQNSAVSAANPTERKERAEGGGGTAQRGYPARCPHCSAAAGEAGRGGGKSQALLARGFGRTQELGSGCLGSSLHNERLRGLPRGCWGCCCRAATPLPVPRPSPGTRCSSSGQSWELEH